MQFWNTTRVETNAVSQWIRAAKEVAVTAGGGSGSPAVVVQGDFERDGGAEKGIMIGINFNQCTPEIQKATEELILAIELEEMKRMGQSDRPQIN